LSRTRFCVAFGKTGQDARAILSYSPAFGDSLKQNPDSSGDNLPEPQHGCPAVQVGDGDFFWESNGTLQFPEMAGNVDVQLKQYTDVR